MRPSQKIRKLTFPLRQRVNRWFRPDIWSGGPPSGLFSEREQLGTFSVRGEIVHDGQQLPAIPPDSEIRAAGLQQDGHADWVALWTRRDIAFLAGPSLAHVDASGRVCLEAAYGPHAWADPAWRRKSPLPLRELAGDYTSVVSRWNDGSSYYHWFLDGLTRLVHLPDFPSECGILVPRGLPAFARRSLELLELTSRVVETGNEDLRIERYWFAGPTMLSGCPDPAGVAWLRSRFLRGPAPERHRFLYLERNVPTRKLTNAREVANLFRKHGWEIIDPATAPLDEQIHKFREARAVAGAHGAALTNLLWTSPGTRVLELMPSRRRNACYAGISLVADLNHQCLVCQSHRHGDMRVPLDRLSSMLKSFFEKP